jgi:hypothetical protein
MEQWIIDGMIGVAGGIVAAAIYNWGVPLLRSRREDRRLARFWHFKHNIVYIIRPTYCSPRGEEIEENMARVEDILAIDTLMYMLKRRKMHYKIVGHSATVPQDADIILICSPKGNKKSEEIQKTLPLAYSFNMDNPAKPYFVDKDTKVEYWSPGDKNAGNKDIALVGRYTKKDTGRKVFLLWGIHGAGTLGAAKCSIDGSQLDLLNRETGDNDFAVLVECEYSTVSEVQNCRLLVRSRIHRRD